MQKTDASVKREVQIVHYSIVFFSHNKIASADLLAEKPANTTTADISLDFVVMNTRGSIETWTLKNDITHFPNKYLGSYIVQTHV